MAGPDEGERMTPPVAPVAPILGESHDQFGRKIEYLRISVTDRCNFRCQYCMPVEGLPWLPKADILRYEEIADVVRQLAPMGLRRLRITGGEPTIRPQLAQLLHARIARRNDQPPHQRRLCNLPRQGVLTPT